MKFMMPLFFAALFLTGCNGLDGQLNVSSKFSLKNQQNETNVIEVGTYTAELRQSTFGKKIVLKLNNDQNEKYNFRIPEGRSIPENGSFKLDSGDVGQNVDLAGNVRTTYQDSEIRAGYQQCTVTEPVTVCYPSPQGTMCRTEMRTINGMQWMRYYDRTTTQDVAMHIMKAGTTAEAAQFNGNGSWVQRIVIDQMPCR